MSEERDPRIRALIVELAESSRAAPSFDELEELREQPGSEPSLVSTPRRRVSFQRPWLAAVAVAVMVLLVGGLVSWLGSSEPESPAVTQLTVPSSTQPSVTSIPEGSGGWVLIVDEEAFPARHPQGVAVNAVVVGGPGLVAVGRDEPSTPGVQTEGTAPTTVAPGSAGGNAAVWISDDGASWHRVAHDESVLGGPGDQVMQDVVAAGPGLVAVGGEASFESGSRVVVWVSSDGHSWSRVHDEPGGTMIAVTVGGPGLVAVGHVETGAAVWTSPDGTTWSRLPDPSGVFEGATINDITTGPSGLVAVGSGVWTSLDGDDWTAVAAIEDPEMRAVGVGGPGLIAVGWEGSVWLSTDGSDWSRQETGPETFAGGSHRLDVIEPGGLGVIVVAQAGFPGPGALWTSRDGVAWERFHADFAPEPGSYVNDMAASETGLVAVGSVEDFTVSDSPTQGSVGQGAVWVFNSDR